MRARGPVAQGTGEGQAYGVGLLVVEFGAVIPGANLVGAGQRTIGVRLPLRARTICVLQFGDGQSSNVEREAHAMGMARWRVRRIPRDRAPVEDAPEQSCARPRTPRAASG